MERHATKCLSRALLAGVVTSALLVPAEKAWAQEATQDAGDLSVEQRVGQLERRVREQQDEIAALKEMLSQANDNMLAMMHGRGLNLPPPQVAPAWAVEGGGYAIPSPTFGALDRGGAAAPAAGSGVIDGSALAQQAAQAPVTGGAPKLPGSPVGEAPEADEQATVQARVQAVPQGQGVLTPAGRLVIEPSIEYALSASNRLVFRGIELVPGLQIGVIEASNAQRDTFVAAGTFRYGITKELEAEVRVPWLHRNDRIDVVQQRDAGIVRTLQFKENNIGDIEFGLRYQLNRPSSPQDPIFVLGVRGKSDTGKGAFDIGYDEFGIATGLTTGSGFWAVSPAVNFLLPSDPVVIYGGTSYLWHIGRDINKDIGGTLIGHVDPGDAISANLGFGFALNPRFSFSLGYRHSYVLSTKQEIGGTIQRSDKLQVGSMLLGMSYRLAEKTTLNFGFEFGVTEDAPDVALSLRVPFYIDVMK